MTDPRDPRGVRHKLAGALALIALAVVAGCKGVHAIAQFARSLTHPQRRWLRCRPRPGHPREYDVPPERTFRRLLKRVDPDELKDALTGWMAAEDPKLLEVLHAHSRPRCVPRPKPRGPGRVPRGGRCGPVAGDNPSGEVRSHG